MEQQNSALAEAQPTQEGQVKLVIAPTKSAISTALSSLIIQSCQKALSSSSTFTIALSGGSLPSFLHDLPDAFARANVNPQWQKWHVLLADERCVPSSDADSNLGAIRTHFTNGVDIPPSQIYGIDETLLGSSEDIAASYQDNVIKLLLDKKKKSNTDNDGKIDCALLGFGPDGHTCSLFPNHKLLKEQTLLVASIDDSPKAPPSRITLTLPCLNQFCRQIIFCGAGESKRPILQAVVQKVDVGNNDELLLFDSNLGAKVATMQLCFPPRYPCGMVRPRQGCGEDDCLIWLVDEDAAAEFI